MELLIFAKELLIFVGLLVLVAVLAGRFGYDSRDLVQSKEAELACFGMRWGDVALVRPLGRRRRLRRAVARVLFALAEWLSPTLPAARAS